MEVKKKFKLVEDKDEEVFLNDLNDQGYLLESFDGEKYILKETEKQVNYLIEFFYQELSNYEIRSYEKLGYKLIYTFKSTVKGYYYYFVTSGQVIDQDRQLKDRYQNLLKSKTRVDRFSAIIFASTFVFFTWLYFNSGSEIYIFVLLLIVLLGGYFGHIYIETIKRLSEYSKILIEKEGEQDGNNEGRSE